MKIIYMRREIEREREIFCCCIETNLALSICSSNATSLCIKSLKLPCSFGDLNQEKWTELDGFAWTKHSIGIE